MVIDTSTLDKILDKRREFLDKYESIVARYRYEKWNYDHGSSYCCVTTSEPIEPQVRTCGSFFKGTKENAIKHYKTMVDKLKVLAHEEYDKIVEKRLQIRNAGSLSQSTGSVDYHDNFDIYSLFLPSLVQEALGLNVPEFFCGTGFVEFKSLSAKQSGKIEKVLFIDFVLHSIQSCSDLPISCSMQPFRRIELDDYTRCSRSSRHSLVKYLHRAHENRNKKNCDAIFLVDWDSSMGYIWYVTIVV